MSDSSSSRNFSCGCMCAEVFLVPFLLSVHAASRATEEDVPFGIFLWHFLVYLIQFASTLYFFKTLLLARRRKDILDQYISHGSLDVVGLVTKHHITLHRTNCIETRQSHTIEYVYRVVDEEDGRVLIYNKTKFVVYHCTLCRGDLWRASREGGGRPTIPLKRLPLMPGSGYPTHLVHEELNGYWPRTIWCMLGSLGCAIFLPQLLNSMDKGDNYVHIIIACLWSFAAGIHMGQNLARKWEEGVLTGGEVTSGVTEVEAVAIPVDVAPAVPPATENFSAPIAPVVEMKPIT